MKVWYKQATSEAELITGCKEGVSKYEELLYKSYASSLFPICLRYASNYHEAEDVLQESFMRIFRAIKSFRGDGSFEGWMKRIVVNTSIEWYKKNLAQHRSLELEAAEYENVHDDVWQQIEARELLNFIQKLAPGYRTIFNLYVIEGYTHKEIATLLGISEGTSKSQFARSRVILQRMILQANKTRIAAAVL
jgi:RNA polymerase sigma factor (sigma-70 family)